MNKIELPVKGTDRFYTLHPEKIIALGLNYSKHVKEYEEFDTTDSGNKLPSEPILFPKTPNVLVASGESVIIPRFLSTDYHFEDMRIDYEAELALIISRKCKNVSPEEALDYVLGYTCMNDVSMRNLQLNDESGWFRGKSLDTFGPIGPVLVPAGDIPDPQNLDIRCRLNGRVVQDSNTKYMIFSIKEMISFISKHFTLEEGDIILTGTPDGIDRISHGDVVEVEIEGIGVLSNPVVDESLI